MDTTNFDSIGNMRDKVEEELTEIIRFRFV